MNTGIHSPLIRIALVAFLALDLLGLVALFYDQAFSVESPQVWVVSAVLVIMSIPLLARLADAIIDWASEDDSIPNSGEKIP